MDEGVGVLYNGMTIYLSDDQCVFIPIENNISFDENGNMYILHMKTNVDFEYMGIYNKLFRKRNLYSRLEYRNNDEFKTFDNFYIQYIFDYNDGGENLYFIIL